MHQMGADQSSEDQRVFDDVLRKLSQTEQQKDDQRDGDLDTHGIAEALKAIRKGRKNASITS